VVNKPAEASPLSARLLAEIAEKAGLPPGVLNLVSAWCTVHDHDESRVVGDATFLKMLPDYAAHC